MAVAWKEIAIAYYIIGKWEMGNGEWGIQLPFSHVPNSQFPLPN
ncbi:hypothetical protein [Tolypothrix sp. NIES-4075]|nr:hypothetical protein [Tolypothrix sp. NIES-4075]